MFDFHDLQKNRIRVYYATSFPDVNDDFTARLSDRDPDWPEGQVRTFNIENMPEGWKNYGDQKPSLEEELEIYGDDSPDEPEHVFEQPTKKPRFTSIKPHDVFGFVRGGFKVYTALTGPDGEGDFVAELTENDPDYAPGEYNFESFNINNMPEYWQNYGDTQNVRGERKVVDPAADLNSTLYIVGAVGALILVLVLNG